MNHILFAKFFENSPCILGEGAVIAETFGLSVALLHRELGLKIVGGCCGTDDRHIRSLAARLGGRCA